MTFKSTLQTVLIIFAMTVVIGLTSTATRANDLQRFAFPSAIGAQDFTLVNETGVEIYALYVTPNRAKDWGDDILGVDTLPAGDSVLVNFAPNAKYKYWDIRVEDEDGNYIEWAKFNLLAISEITLYYRNGKATAIYK